MTAPTIHRLTFGGVLRSEWIKLRSLRSTLWCYLIIVVLTIGLGLLIAGALPAPTTGTPTPSHDVQQSTWVTVSTLGIGFAQLVSAVLGALVITGEYGTGMIRSTFAAVPKRLPAIVAKALVFAVTTFVVALVGLVITALAAAPLLPAKGITPDFGDGKVWLALVGGAGYVALIGLLAFGIGLIIREQRGRHRRGARARAGRSDHPADPRHRDPCRLAGQHRSVPAQQCGRQAVRVPGCGGRVARAGRPGGATSAAAAAADTIVLDSWQALLVVLGWVLVALAIGAILLKRRDA